MADVFGIAWCVIFGGFLGYLAGSNKAKEKEATRRDQLLERFPEAAGELDFIRSMVDDGYSQAQSFSRVPVPSDKSAADFEACGRYHFFGATFTMCMLALDYIAEEDIKVDKDVLGAIFEQARYAAFKFNHAVMTGASLRESQTVEHEPVSPILVPDDDLEDVEMAIRKYEAGGLKNPTSWIVDDDRAPGPGALTPASRSCKPAST